MVLRKQSEIYNNRFCWKCKRKLYFQEFWNRNCELNKNRAVKLWESKYIEFLCCYCYEKVVLKNNSSFTNNLSINRNNLKKVVFLGLGNSGKTAILKMIAFQDLEDSLNLCPTKGLDISELEIHDNHFILWDFGGAENYLKKWIERPYGFGYISELFYCIDIQDKNCLEKSFHYFYELYPLLQKVDAEFPFDGDFKINFLFHKSDPSIRNSLMITKNINSLKHKIKELELGYDFEIYCTSLCNFDKEREAFLQKYSFNQSELKFSKVIELLFT